MAITKEDVLEFISNLSVLELSELVKEFEEKYHIEGVYLNPQLVYDLLPVYKNHFKKFRKQYKEGKYGNLERSKRF